MAAPHTAAAPNASLQGVVVAVTGITGFVGSELVRQLLEQGAAVHAVVRSAPPSLVDLTRDLALDDLPGTLQFVTADLSSEESMTAALKGAVYVFHVASPFVISAEDPQASIIRPAVEGTAAVVRAAAHHKDTLKRIVVTSSVCAVHDCHATQRPLRERYDEADWNEASTADKEPYWVSKVEAERVAWKLSKELGLDLVTILPNFVMGPIVSPQSAKGLSVGFMKSFVEAPDGKVPEGSWTFSDVRDVARAHILAATHPSASGRYIVSQPATTSGRQVTDALKATGLPLHIPDGAPAEEVRRVDASRVERELGLSYTPIAQTLADMARSLVQLGVAKAE